MDKWAGLVDHWKNQTVNYLGIDYKFAKIDEIPANATYDKHTYTIYLAPVAADIYYQVKLEDKNGHVTATLVQPTSLSKGEGHQGQPLTDVERGKWQQLLRQYATYTTEADQNGKTITYRLVTSDDPITA